MPRPALAVAAEARADLASADDDFARPRFRRRDVATALGVEPEAFQNWQLRGQIALEADGDRGGRWRLFNARDALRLAVAVALTRAGLPASSLKAVLARIEDAFPFSTANPYLASGRPAALVATFGGAVIGPLVGNTLDLDETPEEAVIVLRMAEIVRQVLPPPAFTPPSSSSVIQRTAHGLA